MWNKIVWYSGKAYSGGSAEVTGLTSAATWGGSTTQDNLDDEGDDPNFDESQEEPEDGELSKSSMKFHQKFVLVHEDSNNMDSLQFSTEIVQRIHSLDPRSLFPTEY